MAGLVTAYRLTQAGMPVVVLEANDSVGGRLASWSTGWTDGQHCDLGGELIDTSYHACVALAGELGVELSEPVRYAEPDSADVSAVEGYLRVGRFLRGDRVLSDAEKTEIMVELRSAVSQHAPEDREIVEQWIQRARLTPQTAYAVRAVNRLLAQMDAEADVHYVFNHGSSEFRRVRGGSQNLPNALAERVDVRLGQDVTRVERRGPAVTVQTADGQVWEAARVVCAVSPFRVPTIGFDPPLPSSKLEAVLSLHPSMGGKLLAQYAEGAEIRDAMSRGSYSDGPIHTAWVGNPYVTDGPASVAGFVSGPQRHLLGDRDRAMAALDRMVGALVGRPVTRIAGTVKNWSADPQALGVSVLPFGPSRERIASTITHVEGRVHFTGDYTDPPLSGTIEGAVRSGERTALEVLRVPERVSSEVVNSQGVVR